jgi:hypothetical protein
VLKRWKNRALGPGEKTAAALAALLLVAGLTYGVVRLLPDACGSGLERAGDECVGVTAGELDGDPGTEGLIKAVAAENARVEKDWTDPVDGRPRIPYVRIALMMPFTSDATSTMSTEQIIRALAGAHAAQLRANEKAGPQYQLLLANNGRNIDHWEPVVERLAGMAEDEEFPLVGVLGMPSSTQETQDTVDSLSKHRIPAIGPVITSVDMKAEYFFKTSPSNASFARALGAYLAENPGKGEGFLVADDRQGDNYSLNLRQLYEENFEEYGLRQRVGYFLGTTGEDEGIPVRFSEVAQKICLTGADTIFFAGRDRDLPYLIRHIADAPTCADAEPMRILKVGIGMDPEHTDPEITQELERAGVILVNAASVAPGWWAEDAGQSPSGLAGFLARYAELDAEHELGEKALDDGYAIMYHDAFTVLSQATDRALDDINGSAGAADGGDLMMPTTNDVYNTVINMNILGIDDGTGCINCVRGASGTFGFDNSPDTEKWAVCKPVPVILHPAPTGADVPRVTGTTYRTHEGMFDASCP